MHMRFATSVMVATVMTHFLISHCITGLWQVDLGLIVVFTLICIHYYNGIESRAVYIQMAPCDSYLITTRRE
jgi:hypothetical protein